MRGSRLLAPLNTTGTGLYLRMWRRAFPSAGRLTDKDAHYEIIRGSRIDDAERYVRHVLTVPDRQLTAIECSGRHHAEPVDCPFASTPAAA